MTTIESLKTREAGAASAFADLIGMVANGQAVDEGEATAILSACGRTVTDLEAEVSRFGHVAELRTKIAAQEADLAKLEEERAGLPNASELLAEARRLESEANTASGRHQAVTFGIFQGGQSLNKLRKELAELEGESHD